MQHWWVNQKQTWRQEILGNFMWSPKRNSNGARNQFYDNMRLVDSGDLVFSYYNRKIQNVGIVLRPAISGQKPNEFGAAGGYWSDEGWYVPVLWHKLPNPLSPTTIIHKIRPFLPQKYSPIDPNTGRGRQIYLASISEAMATVLAESIGPYMNSITTGMGILDDGDQSIEKLESIVERAIENDPNLEKTVKEALIKARKGQGEFRQNLQNIERSCRLTGVSDSRFLVASHIKPWRSCRSSKERLDGNNGLLLAPHADRLFDRGYISFTDHGDVLVSPKLDKEQAKLMGLNFDELKTVGPFSSQQSIYLRYHRAEVFLKE